ncbi:hypothetical protein D3C74_405140 [compost metagenome]
MQISMKQCLSMCQEFFPQQGHFKVELPIRAKGVSFIFNGSIIIIFFSDPVGFIKDQIFRYFALVRVNESALLFLLQLLIHTQVGCEEQRSRHEFPNMLCKKRIGNTFNQTLAHDHMITQIFHNG